VALGCNVGRKQASRRDALDSVLLENSHSGAPLHGNYSLMASALCQTVKMVQEWFEAMPSPPNSPYLSPV